MLENVTVDEALETVARTFRQLVIYGECTQPGGGGILSIYYTPLTGCVSDLQDGNPCFVPEARMGRQAFGTLAAAFVIAQSLQAIHANSTSCSALARPHRVSGLAFGLAAPQPRHRSRRHCSCERLAFR